MDKKIKKYVGTFNAGKVVVIKDLEKNQGVNVNDPFKNLKLISVYMERDDADEIPTILINEGQKFAKLFKAFNKQDKPDTNPDWMGFSAFMKANGVKVVEDFEQERLEYYQ